ncbi:MAG: NRDE family protein [Pyrinomonadaceae bacterium]
MCVIYIAFHVRKDYPLILLANRDEYYSRPTESSHRWPDHPEILAGRDTVSGGTWLGVTEGGRFAAVTNYRDPNEKKRGTSRGSLVADFLRSKVPAEDFLTIAREKAHEFAGFNLIVGEMNARRNELYYFSNRIGTVEKLEKGIYGLSNRLLDTPWPKVDKGKNALSDNLDQVTISVEPLFEMLRDETPADDESLPDTGIGYEREKLLSAIFIKSPDYGTRCSTVLRFDATFNFDFDERVFV